MPNVDYHFFCGIHLGHHRLTSYKIVSQIRCELSQKLNTPKAEKVFLITGLDLSKTKIVLLPMPLVIKVKFTILQIKNCYGKVHIGRIIK